MKEEQCVEEKSRRHPRWTRQETLTLIQAKDITENRPHKGRKIWASENSNSEPKWVMISAYCKQQGVARGPAQCRKRWSNLIGDYKKISTWEANFKDKGNVIESFWTMRNDVRKEWKLPVSFDWEVFKVLAGREMSGPEPFSPLPLQAVAASVTQVSYGGNDEDDVKEDEMAEDVEPEPENEDEKTVNDKEGLGFEDVVLLDEGKEKDEILELGLESRDQTTVKHFMESPSNVQEPSSVNFKESWPGISYWDSQEKKRRRVSTDDLKANNIEAEMMKLLEANNKMVNAQLDIHNKNIQLDREHRKESTDVLVAALGQLTNALVKIAEKL